jgi:hypothetical protein
MSITKKKISIFFKTYKYEIIVFLVNLTTAYIAFIFRDILILFLSFIFIFILSFILVIYFRTSDKDFYYLPLDKPGQEKDWVGRGIWKYVRSEKCFEITKSHVGFIFPKTFLWDDYSFEFDFKIVNRTCAWIVRAVNLSNYIMLQCAFEGINPHIRLDGEWLVKSHSDKDVNLTFREQLEPDKWYRAKVMCEKRSIRISIIDAERTIFDRHWVIPDTLAFVYKFKVEEGRQEEKILQRPIDFDFGAIGFRNSGDERGFIRDVHVQRL